MTSTILDDELIIRSSGSKGVTLIPNAANEYVPVKWLDQQGNTVAAIVAHELNTEGDIHNHLSIYTCDANRIDRWSRFDMEFGKDLPIFSFERCIVRMKGDKTELHLRSPNNKYWRVKVNDNGVLSTEAV